MLHQMELKKRDSIIETKTLDWFIKEQCGLSLDSGEADTAIERILLDPASPAATGSLSTWLILGPSQTRE